MLGVFVVVFLCLVAEIMETGRNGQRIPCGNFFVIQEAALPHSAFTHQLPAKKQRANHNIPWYISEIHRMTHFHLGWVISYCSCHHLITWSQSTRSSISFHHRSVGESLNSVNSYFLYLLDVFDNPRPFTYHARIFVELLVILIPHE